MRLFVGAWPPPQVLELLAAIERPQVAHLRWTTQDQWHVTLCFLGERDAEDVGRIGAVLTGVVAGITTPIEVRAGPALEVLGRSVLCVPVVGLELAAEALRAALAPVGVGEGAVPSGAFRGHLTLARTRGGRRVPSGLAGVAFDARWHVDALSLVSSALEPSGARYTAVATATVRPEGPRHPTSNVRSPLESSRSLQGSPEPPVGTTSSASPDGTPPP